MKKRVAFLLLTPLSIWALTNFATLTPHTWTVAPSPTMENTSGVVPSPVPWPNGNAFREVWASWGSGAWDNDSNWLYVFGGGHTYYSGNEVYIFDVSTEAWRRIFGPTDTAIINNSGSVETSGYYGKVGNLTVPDSSAPRSRHTYNTLQVVNGKLVAWACIFTYISAQSAANTDEFDPVTKTWTHRDLTLTNFDYGNASGVDSATGKLWVFSGGSGGYIGEYSGTTHVWTDHGNFFGGNDLNNKLVGSAIVPSLHRLYAFGEGIQGYWDLNGSFPIAIHTLTTSGPQKCVNATGPGIDWDPVSQRLACWSGSDSVYTYNPTDSTWAGIAVAGGNVHHPTSAQASGTFGRWRYMPSKNAFILSNASSDSIYYYKLTADPVGPTKWGAFGNDDIFMLKFGF